MTLVISIQTNRSLWLMADRRLTVNNEVIRDDAMKVCSVDTQDGKAIVGYAGLGATAAGMEPSEWISNSLRGFNGTLEQTLNVLVEATSEVFTPYLSRIVDRFEHLMLIPAYVKSSRVYSIQYKLVGKQAKVDFIQLLRSDKGFPSPPRVCAIGSGAALLSKDQVWQHKITGLVRAFNNGRIQGPAVADELNTLCQSVHAQMKRQGNNTVGDRSIVVWKELQKGGGGHIFYTGCVRDEYSPSIPMLANGIDVQALASRLFPHAMELFEKTEAHRKAGFGEISPSTPAMRDFEQKAHEVAKSLLTQPDKRLR